MISYRFKRRAFLSAMSGGLGLKIMLRNLEVSAQGMKSPGRLLVTHWPVGIVAGSGDALFKPSSGSVGGSLALKPFADAGLGPDMTVFRGISTANFNLSGGGSHEQGTVELVTGLTAGGTRASCCEGDDAYAAPGGSFEQILLKNVTALQRPGQGYANSIADSRTDFAEVSTQCLSYSTSSQSVKSYSGGSGTEAIPLKPTLSALSQFNSLFSNFAPGGGSGGAVGTGGGSGTGGRSGTGSGGAGGSGGPPVAPDMLKKLASRKSVLDFAIEEINQMKGMVPSDARNKLQIHSDAIMSAESSVVAAINSQYPNVGGATGGASGSTGGRGGSTGGGTGGSTGSGGAAGGVCGTCSSKPTAPANVMGGVDPNSGNGTGNAYGNDGAKSDDSATHEAAGKAHLDVLKAAFICDLIRVGTYQWSPGTNHVGFKLYPGSTGIYQHHPVSHRIGTQDTIGSSTVAGLNANAGFLYAVQVWYWQKHADNLATWKTALDGCGNSLLDNTIVPFLTEVAATGHERSNMPGMLIGGKSLGFNHDIYKTGNVSINSLWGTIGQAFGYTGGGPFGSAVSGIWTKPA